MQQKKLQRIWVVLRRRERVVKDYLMEGNADMALGEGLVQACKEFDVAVPVVLNKHTRDLEEFSRAVFFARDFMEAFPYQALEVHVLAEEDH